MVPPHGFFSEPVDEKCNVQKPDNGKFDWTTVLVRVSHSFFTTLGSVCGFLIAIGAIVMATFSTGIDSKSFQVTNDSLYYIDKMIIPYQSL
ncbi:hypothetical protein Gorai_001559, partial [Gossypium raimondii]|nr:hypothetical protein [Gossypium raimondii]